MKTPPHFLVIIPGFMGSKLRDKTSNEVVWVDFSTIPTNPLAWQGWLERFLNHLAYPNEDIEAFQVLDEFIIASPWAKQEHYQQLFDVLLSMGYHFEQDERERNVYTFPYDWRQDNRISALQLGEAIERWHSFHPHAKAWIIAHSNGGNIARWYIEQLGGKEHVERLFLLGVPGKGTPKAMRVLIAGLDTLFRRRFNLFGIPSLTRTIFRTFPSMYQLLPYQQPFMFDENNQPINILDDQGWLTLLKENEISHLNDGQKFFADLGDQLSIDSVCIFGRRYPTTNLGIVSYGANQSWQKVEWISNETGDGTVPERSAIFANAQRIYPFSVTHGELYNNPAVLNILSWELYAKYSMAKRATLETPQLHIVFNASPDIVAEGEPIHLFLSVHKKIGKEEKAIVTPSTSESLEAVKDIQVQVQMVWRQALPASEPIQFKHFPLSCRLVCHEAGVFVGTLFAPYTEGYYDMRGLVVVKGFPPVFVNETILVENELNNV